MQPVASMVRSALKPAGMLPPMPAIFPSAMAMSACLSMPDAGSTTRPLAMWMFMRLYFQ